MLWLPWQHFQSCGKVGPEWPHRPLGQEETLSYITVALSFGTSPTVSLRDPSFVGKKHDLANKTTDVVIRGQSGECLCRILKDDRFEVPCQALIK
jgi:hypothetical protein